MKKILLVLSITLFAYSCQSGKHVDFEKNTELAKDYFNQFEKRNIDAVFEYLHPDIEWHMPVYGLDMGGIEEVKEAILGYQSEYDDLKFTADYWLPGVNTETGKPDGSTRVYGTWTSTHKRTGKKTKLTSYHSFEFQDGKIIRGGDWFDLGGMMNSLEPSSLLKGNLIGLHKLKIKLNKGFNIDDFEDYFTQILVPAYNKAYMGAKVHLIKSNKGTDLNSLGMLWIFESEEFLSKLWNSDGTSTELNTSINESLADVNSGLSKIGTWTSEFSDWLVQ